MMHKKQQDTFHLKHLLIVGYREERIKQNRLSFLKTTGHAYENSPRNMGLVYLDLQSMVLVQSENQVHCFLSYTIIRVHTGKIV